MNKRSRSSRLILLLGSGLVSGALALGGCDEPPATSVSGPASVEVTDTFALARTAPALAPILKCNNDLIKFTTSGSGVTNSSGGGATLGEAMTDAVANAIVDNVLNQYSCDSCPGGWPCEPFWDPATVDTAGAYLEGNPGDNCHEEPDGSWECHGDVNFNTGGGNPAPSVQAGCRTCEESWRHTQWTPIIGRN